FSPAALRLLEAYAWPGNIRELQNIVQFALMKCRTETVEVADLPPYLQEQTAGGRGAENGEGDSLVSCRKKFTPEQVLDAIRRTGGNKLAAARELGISRATLYRFLEKMMT
ncbi:MAG: helix-turn-helix domain-containing protein, partial [Thermodesulfobacteriota bacterium]